jgi:hypothetical protein
MAARYSAEAKQREQETRARLGRRLPRSPNMGHPITAPPRAPRATGVNSHAIRDGRNNGA